MLDWTRVHHEFPVNQRLVWLNNCGTTPTPRPVLDAVKAHLDGYAERSVLVSAEGEWAVHGRACGRLARLLGAEPDELALIHNTSEGMTFISHGLALAPGERIVLMQGEYPSNVYPWEHWRERGVAIDLVPCGQTPDEALANLQAALRPDVRVLSVSAVHWCTGMPLPLEPLGRLCAQRDIHFVVDGAQGVGHVPLDLRALGVDSMAFSGWKWLLGPLGIGGLFVRRERLAGLRFPFKGTGSVIDDDRYLPYRAELKPGTARYVLSTPSFTDWVYFDASLAYLEGLGWSSVMARIHELAGALADGARRLGFEVASDRFPGTPTGIVAASKPGHDADALVAGLRRAGVIAASRLGRVRMAPHVYLSETQIDVALNALGAMTGR